MLHVLLEADEPTLRSRIEADEELAVARQWRLDHLPKFAEARSWIARRADLTIDATRLTAEQVAARVWEAAKGADRICRERTPLAQYERASAGSRCGTGR